MMRTVFVLVFFVFASTVLADTVVCGKLKVSVYGMNFNGARTYNMVVQGDGVDVFGFPTFWVQKKVQHSQMVANIPYDLTTDQATGQKALNGVPCQ